LGAGALDAGGDDRTADRDRSNADGGLDCDSAGPQRYPRRFSGKSGGRRVGAALRERGRLWQSRPAPIMVLASVGVIGCLAAAGVFMSALPLRIIGMLVGTTIVFTLALDSIKLAVFARLRID